ncbi:MULTISPECIES: tetratricopeptide repeat protein [Micromonospora]|uniref:Tetratricopeptide repeat protein n=1 Tax=Micromonospora solifontis TaxID=2487138 RepID=A0ABX9WNK0_9ACTN|nr:MULTISPECIES: tetratricopeptide repeat protein [Micromonospora]NES14927.1 tetratricopeptide repeat protein [Micromonospora sp. PPF5-17B]NES35150.1 tetratricopeptide repeat protein [Micromonospora solifontis]NES55145.1 tetratricopeptide repeat protein [Micromonospora sp. PPF5-6]RNM01134.1 tetratricopeptide repeat protein [Micromonospora solifontis]
MSSGFGELTVQAHHLVSEGDLAGAQRLLADALTDADPRPANASPELADAAGLQARVLVALGEPHSARGWAAFAYAATTRLYGRSDERTVTAAATLAAVLHRVGSDARAARLYSDVIIELTARDGPESQRVLAAHADLATVEYARGQCQVARDRLQDAWELHREVYGDGHPSGIKMLAKLGAMERDCGRYAESHEHLTLAEELCALHLAPDDPLAGQVATLVRAAADPDHACVAPEPPARERPVVPGARIPPAAEGPPEPLLYHPPQRTPEPAPEPPLHHPAEHPVEPAEAAHPSVPTPRTPPDADDDFAGPAGDWWPPEEPYDDRVAGESALPPTVVGLTGAEPAGEDPAGVRRVPGATEPEPPSRYLPVHVPRPPAPERQATPWLPLVVVGVIVALLLGTIAVVAGVSRVDRSRGTPASAPTTGGTSPTGTPAGTPTAAPASPGTPPGRVRLTDRRDSIVLSWTYPAGAEGPVVIAGGRSRDTQHTFEELPAGTDSYTAYGLSRSQDYCFTVAVVWSTDTVARAAPVCTDRG